MHADYRLRIGSLRTRQPVFSTELDDGRGTLPARHAGARCRLAVITAAQDVVEYVDRPIMPRSSAPAHASSIHWVRLGRPVGRSQSAAASLGRVPAVGQQEPAGVGQRRPIDRRLRADAGPVPKQCTKKKRRRKGQKRRRKGQRKDEERNKERRRKGQRKDEERDNEKTKKGTMKRRSKDNEKTRNGTTKRRRKGSRPFPSCHAPPPPPVEC